MTTLTTSNSPWRTRLLTMICLMALLAWVPSVQARTPLATAPKPGGSVSARLIGSPECLDTTKQSLAVDSATNAPVIDTLLSLNDKGKPVPYLAQSYKVSQGGKLLTFTLRHDIKFSDGRPLTAADVKYTFDRILDPTTKSPISKNFLGPVTSIVTSGKYTVKIHLSAPNRVLLSNLGIDYLGIVERRSVDAAGSNTCNGLVGSGPFTISSVAPGYASITETRNKHHAFGPSWAHNKGPAYLSSLTFQAITSDSTAVSELLGGQLDITNVPGDQLSRVQGNKSLALYRILTQGAAMIEFNGAHAPFDNLAVRKAVAQAIDRSTILKGALNGLGKPSYSPLASSILDYNPKSQSYVPKQDVAAAQRAITAAGAKGPYTLSIFTSPATTAAAEIIQAELAQVGMTVNIVSNNPGGWIAGLRKGDFDMTLLSYTFNDPDVLYLIFHSSQKAGLNFWNLPNDTVDRMTLAGRSTLDLKKARADYYKAQQVLDQQVIGVPLWVPITVTAFRNRVKGIHLTASGQIQYQDLYIGK